MFLSLNTQVEVFMQLKEQKQVIQEALRKEGLTSRLVASYRALPHPQGFFKTKNFSHIMIKSKARHQYIMNRFLAVGQQPPEFQK
jgi:hypothetical protein